MYFAVPDRKARTTITKMHALRRSGHPGQIAEQEKNGKCWIYQFGNITKYMIISTVNVRHSFSGCSQGIPEFLKFM